MFSAHSLAGVCGSVPEEMVGTKLGGEGWIVVILDYFKGIGAFNSVYFQGRKQEMRREQNDEALGGSKYFV
jgi:hypothetical protein